MRDKKEDRKKINLEGLIKQNVFCNIIRKEETRSHEVGELRSLIRGGSSLISAQMVLDCIRRPSFFTHPIAAISFLIWGKSHREAAFMTGTEDSTGKKCRGDNILLSLRTHFLVAQKNNTGILRQEEKKKADNLEDARLANVRELQSGVELKKDDQIGLDKLKTFLDSSATRSRIKDDLLGLVRECEQAGKQMVTAQQIMDGISSARALFEMKFHRQDMFIFGKGVPTSPKAGDELILALRKEFLYQRIFQVKGVNKTLVHDAWEESRKPRKEVGVLPGEGGNQKEVLNEKTHALNEKIRANQRKRGFG